MSAGEAILGAIAFGDGSLEVVLHDLLHEKTDGIVNAANGGLSHGGGVAAAIAEAAGPELEEAGDRIVAERGQIPVGEAVLTTAGRLSFKGVIHAVGPRQGQGEEEAKLQRALVSAFRIAAGKGWRSLSFPAVSSGIFGVPAKTCARAYVKAAREHFAAPGSLLKLRLVLVEGPVADAFRTSFAKKGA
jgi:O-acetyl-ADP-ribose deacetylase (regulator of RNase III)